MSRAFRLVPPEPRRDLLTRPRLLRSLAGRWEHRVTSMTAGAGLGKTTLLAQAIAENRLSPRGDDVWVGLEPHDADAAQLARVVAAALADRRIDEGPDASGEQPRPEPRAIAEAVWHRAPSQACIVLDDVHMLPAGSTGAQWLAHLLAAMPTNGHMVLASRAEPPMPLSRFGVEGAVLWLGESDLRFSDDELAAFAARQGLDPRRLAATGGWPAMAALVASLGRQVSSDYLWEEVLDPLGPDGRRVLAVLADLGGGDDALLSATLDRPVDLTQVLDGVPLIARSREGWHVAHALWTSAPGAELTTAERSDTRRRAAAHLAGRRRFDDAFRLLEEAGLWDAAPTVLRAACLSADTLDSFQLGHWLDACPPEVLTTSAGRFAEGLYRSYVAPAEAMEPMQHVRELFEAEDDADAELAVIAQLGRLAWWEGNDAAPLTELAPRVFALMQTGNAKAAAIASFGWALGLDLVGRDEQVLNFLAQIPPGVLDPVFDPLAPVLAAATRLALGEADEAEAILDRLAPRADPAMGYVIAGILLQTWWAQGRISDVLAEAEVVSAAARANGVAYGMYLSATSSTLLYSHVGDLPRARAAELTTRDLVATRSDGTVPVYSSLARASLQLAEGDEATATATLAAAVEAYGLDQGTDRRWWRHSLALSYVLAPDSRAYWDRRSLRGHLLQARQLARLVVASRAGESLAGAELPDVQVVRSLLHHRLAAELAVGLATAQRREGVALLDALGPAGRMAVRDLATGRSAVAKAARALLLSTPAPPGETVHLAVLGPLTVRRDGSATPVSDPELRRQRLQELLAFLVAHRRTTRAAVTAALWPDLDDRNAANNLGVTLNHLLRVFEPQRARGEPAYLVRLEGQIIQLVTDGHLRIDVDEFDAHVALAAQAEEDGVASVALDHHLAAVALYQGDLYADLPEADWFALDREHYRSRFVTAAVRAGHLLLGRGDSDLAVTIANRALTSDPWSEGAYAILVGAALARSDRTTARRMLDRCLAMLDELGAEPTPATERLRRRIRGVAA